MNKAYQSVLAICLALIGLYLAKKNILFVYISLGFGTVCLLSSVLTEKFYIGWNRLSLLLGTISSAIILSIIFFLVVTVIALVARIVGKNFILLKRKEESYFIQRDFLYNKESFENAW